MTSWDEILQAHVLCIQDKNLQLLDFNCPYIEEPGYCGVIDERIQFTPNYRVPESGIDNIEFTYVMDFDREVFTMDNEVHFCFATIPRFCWIKSLSIDGYGKRTAISRLVPEDSLARLVVANDDKPDNSTTSFEHMSVKYVRPKGIFDFPWRCRAGPVSFIYEIWSNIREELERQMRYTLARFLPTDFVFREIAFGIVSCLAGLCGKIRFEDVRRNKGPMHHDYKAIVCGDSLETPAVVASKLAYGYHKEGIEPGSAPSESSYWFRGVLIHLTKDVWNEAGEAAILDAIQIGRTTVHEPESFDILLISIQHVVIVRVSLKSVQRTKPLTLLNIPVHYSHHPEDRYSEKQKEKIPDWYGSQDGSVRAYLWRNSSVAKKALYSSFGAIMHLFESAVTKKLRPEKNKEGIFPTELYEEILRYAVNLDAKTHQACSLVSRKFRRICLESFSLNDDLLLRPCHHTDIWGSHMHNDHECEHFQILDRSDGVTHTVRMEHEETQWHGLTVLCGTYPRLSILSSCSFDPFNTPDPWKGRQLPLKSQSIPEISFDSSHDFIPGKDRKESEHYWQRPMLKNYYIRFKTQLLTCTSDKIHYLWNEIFKCYGDNKLHNWDEEWNPFDVDWTFTTPANTKNIRVKSKSTLRINDEKTSREQWTGYILIKRPNEIISPERTWELARSEAETTVPTLHVREP